MADGSPLSGPLDQFKGTRPRPGSGGSRSTSHAAAGAREAGRRLDHTWGFAHCSGSKEQGQVLEATEAAQVEALAVGDAEIDEYFEFSRGLDPLGDHFGSGLIAKGHHRAGEGTPDWIEIELDGFWGDLENQREAREPRSGVIDGHLGTECPQSLASPVQCRVVLDADVLGELDDHPTWRARSEQIEQLRGTKGVWSCIHCHVERLGQLRQQREGMLDRTELKRSTEPDRGCLGKPTIRSTRRRGSKPCECFDLDDCSAQKRDDGLEHDREPRSGECLLDAIPTGPVERGARAYDVRAKGRPGTGSLARTAEVALPN